MKTYSLDEHTILEVVHERMAQLGLSNRALARCPLISSDPSTIMRFLAGRHDTKTEVLAEIMFALGLGVVVEPAADVLEWING